MSRVYEYWCENVRRSWSKAPCPQCAGERQEQRTDKDGTRLYWFTSECDLICIKCHEELDARDADPEGP